MFIIILMSMCLGTIVKIHIFYSYFTHYSKIIENGILCFKIPKKKALKTIK